MNCTIIIPTYNGGVVWEECARALSSNKPDEVSVLVIDSQSSDNTLEVAKRYGFKTQVIDKKTFNHGGTRNKAAMSLSEDIDIAIFLTQDAIPETDFVEEILKNFEEENVACAYGRQLPHINANSIATHARFFNYPERSHCYSKEDSKTVGLKTVFSSNSFAAYKMSIFREIKGFPTKTILSEDMYFAAQAVLRNYKVAYSADAKVRHSHNYTLMEEFQRYFDIGVFHADQSWIRSTFGGAGGEGKKFIISELSYLIKKSPVSIPRAMINNCLKFAGYKLGQSYHSLPSRVVKKISMHKGFW